MSWGHDDHGHGDKKSGSGISIDIGISSMISWFFGASSGAWAMKKYVEWGGGGHDDHHH